MKRGKKILALFLIITMLLPFVMNIPAEAAEKSKQLDVLFTHDTHSHLNSFSTIVDGEQKEVGGFAKLKTLIDEKKKENPDTLILDGGDFSMGTLSRQFMIPKQRNLGCWDISDAMCQLLEIMNLIIVPRDWQTC